VDGTGGVSYEKRPYTEARGSNVLFETDPSYFAEEGSRLEANKIQCKNG
jgi:hypothetical protein